MLLEMIEELPVPGNTSTGLSTKFPTWKRGTTIEKHDLIIWIFRKGKDFTPLAQF